MSFIYPRTVTISRPGAQPNRVGFQGQSPSSDPKKETLIADCIPASIQASRTGGKSTVELPGDSAPQTWRLYCPKSALDPDEVQNRDIVVDDLGRRFQVVADYVNSLGAGIHMQRLEV